MGWWGYDVMEGDGPSDLACVIPAEGSFVDACTAVRNHETIGAYYGDDPIVAQTVGYVFMSEGRPLSPSDRGRILRACANDAWARKEPKRRAALDDFVHAVITWDGTPWDGTSKGLFDTYAEKAKAMAATPMKPGQKGWLMNVGPEVSGLKE